MESGEVSEPSPSDCVQLEGVLVERRLALVLLRMKSMMQSLRKVGRFREQRNCGDTLLKHRIRSALHKDRRSWGGFSTFSSHPFESQFGCCARFRRNPRRLLSECETCRCCLKARIPKIVDFAYAKHNENRSSEERLRGVRDATMSASTWRCRMLCRTCTRCLVHGFASLLHFHVTALTLPTCASTGYWFNLISVNRGMNDEGNKKVVTQRRGVPSISMHCLARRTMAVAATCM